MRKMKDSGIEWIGEIPTEWSIVPLTKKIETIVDYRGKTPTKVSDGVFLVTAKNIKNGKIDYEISKEYVDKSEYEEIMHRGKPQIGDLLFTTEAPLGAVANVDKEYIALAQRVIKFTPTNDVSSYFLKYWIMNNGFQQFLQTLSTGSTASGIKASKLFMLPLIYCPLNEQNSIVSFLDNQCAHIDSIIEKTKLSIEEYKKLKQAVITQAVTKGVRGEREMKDSGVEWIGKIPSEWKVTTVLNKIEFDGGSQPPLTQFIHEPKEGYVRLIQNRDYKTDDYITFVPISSVRKFCDENDVMVGRYGPPVFVLHRGLKGAYNVALMKAIPKGIDRQWMFYFLQETTMLEYIKSFSKRAAGQDGVDTAILKKYPMCIPTLVEQTEIAAYLDKKCSEIDALITKKENFLKELENYKKSVIYEYVTGKKEVL